MERECHSQDIPGDDRDKSTKSSLSSKAMGQRPRTLTLLAAGHSSALSRIQCKLLRPFIHFRHGSPLKGTPSPNTVSVTHQLPGDQLHRSHHGAPLVSQATLAGPGAFALQCSPWEPHPLTLLPFLLQGSGHPSPLSCQHCGCWTQSPMPGTGPVSPSVLTDHPQGLPESRAQTYLGIKEPVRAPSVLRGRFS